ncbi:50S ribosomal protein L25 [Sphingomonas sp. Leaf412]|uniref:50S ribosomal protein L25/general stress protein Ctc n=1 Tax=Sphingomonas sp. Leaf412 TaxID=1736370 RepID=UPI0006F3B7BF|nr:50S ribosomal protein L25/general stress protein Ctc [Sphingomonas sp. Leaf412]KQT31716.1 50S ribosomal protein L25 [Sphingomonas sp. Leaf412]
MSDTLTLAAETRDRVGKGASRSLRRDGRVPAVIYGQNKEPTSIHLEEKALVKALSSGHFMTTVVTINGQRTLPKDVHFHPVSDRPVHVDFLRIRAHETVTVQVPVHFTDEDESVYLKQGGVLNVVAHEIAVTCDAAEIPTEIAISLKGREIGDTIHLGDVTFPKGVTPAVEDTEYTVATVVPPTVPTAEDEALDAEVAEAQAAEHAEEVEAEAAAEEAEADDADGEGDKAE